MTAQQLTLWEPRLAPIIPITAEISDWTGIEIHWVTILIAREHKLAEPDWTCQCSACSAVRPLYLAQRKAEP